MGTAKKNIESFNVDSVAPLCLIAEDNPLSKESIAFLKGMDWVKDKILNELFGNLEPYKEELSDIGIFIPFIDEDIINSDPNFKKYSEYTEQELMSIAKQNVRLLLSKTILNEQYEKLKRETEKALIMFEQETNNK